MDNWELYDLETDRTESKDLGQKHPEIMDQMASAWGDWSERMGNNL